MKKETNPEVLEEMNRRGHLSGWFLPVFFVSMLCLFLVFIVGNIVKAIIWFFRWIGRGFIANLNVITYIIPMGLAYFVALSLAFLLFIALYL